MIAEERERVGAEAIEWLEAPRQGGEGEQALNGRGVELQLVLEEELPSGPWTW